MRVVIWRLERYTEHYHSVGRGYHAKSGQPFAGAHCGTPDDLSLLRLHRLLGISVVSAARIWLHVWHGRPKGNGRDGTSAHDR